MNSEPDQALNNSHARPEDGEDARPEGGDYAFFTPADDEHVRREKAKARDLRSSQWWKNELAKGRCHYCHRRFHPRELTMDHVVPIIRGGLTRKANVEIGRAHV